jgi:predicted DNA-binding transcriptional regulator AlpA
MGMTEIERRALKGGTRVALTISDIRGPPDPIAVRIPEAIRISGLSRSEIYRRAGRNEIVLLKCGKSTLVEYRSLRATIESLPRAPIRLGKISR